MLVAIVTVHLSRGFWASKGGYEFNLAILAAVAALALTGPGIYSLDQALRTHLPEPVSVLIGTIALIVGVAVTPATPRPPTPAGTQRAAGSPATGGPDRPPHRGGAQTRTR